MSVNNIKILYEDSDIIVCIKPQGMPSQSDKTRDLDMVNYLKNYVYEKDEMEEEPYIAIVHRLDRPVGGVMVFARNQKAAANLSDQIQDGEMEKDYQAVLTGTLPDEEGVLNDYLVKDGKTNTSKVVKKEQKGAKRAELRYEVLDILETEEGTLSYVLIELITGRHHQIRVQTASRGAGIWGDTKYNERFKKTKRVYRQIGLFASRIAFKHPTTKERMVFKEEPFGEAFELLDAEDF
ncbi:MAG: RluA family pseudouridine synthase [Firmicutes bacterium]|uniref:RNA pseudouridylate synthase n=1 Tax=Candidatus Scybalomonas excrementavium TaxID=2840943 RepID=A0A9D9I2X8_9FIRM|nr:RluA family pseudouridine synthase [Candidatus Scybalomonas excrementavium]